MSLPTAQQQTDVVQTLAGLAQPLLQGKLGLTNIDPSWIAAVLEVAVDSICMKAWKQAQAAGQAAADAITTAEQAEASLRKP